MKYYFCDTEGHTNQVLTEEDSPRCVACNAVMTYGRFTHKYETALILKPGLHNTIDGKTVMLDVPVVAQ